MRHSTIGMTLNDGTTFDPELKAASSRISGLVLGDGSQSGSHSS